MTTPVPEGPRAKRPWMEVAWMLFMAFNVFMMGWVVGGQYGERPARLKKEASGWECIAWKAVWSNAQARGTLDRAEMASLRPPDCAFTEPLPPRSQP